MSGNSSSAVPYVGDSLSFPYEGLMVPGLGVNSLTGRPVGSSVVRHGALKTISGADGISDGQTLRTTIKVVKSANELHHQMSQVISGGGVTDHFLRMQVTVGVNLSIFQRKPQ